MDASAKYAMQPVSSWAVRGGDARQRPPGGGSGRHSDSKEWRYERLGCLGVVSQIQLSKVKGINTQFK